MNELASKQVVNKKQLLAHLFARLLTCMATSDDEDEVICTAAIES